MVTKKPLSTLKQKRITPAPDIPDKKSVKGLFDFHFTKVRKEEKRDGLSRLLHDLRRIDVECFLVTDDPISKFHSIFPQFFVKSSMTIAPINRLLHSTDPNFIELLRKQDCKLHSTADI
jgi:hypothetical protein